MSDVSTVQLYIFKFKINRIRAFFVIPLFQFVPTTFTEARVSGHFPIFILNDYILTVVCNFFKLG